MSLDAFGIFSVVIFCLALTVRRNTRLLRYLSSLLYVELRLSELVSGCVSDGIHRLCFLLQYLARLICLFERCISEESVVVSQIIELLHVFPVLHYVLADDPCLRDWNAPGNVNENELKRVLSRLMHVFLQDSLQEYLLIGCDQLRYAIDELVCRCRIFMYVL